MMQDRPLLHMRGISKQFPGVQALSDVELVVYPGEIVALLGENGAGKSTLMRVLTGALSPNAGEIIWQGRPVVFHSPRDALRAGISMIHQELALIPSLDVGKNIYLGREPEGVVPGMIDWPRLYREARMQIERLGLDLDPRTLVRSLSLAQQQMVEVAKALSLDARLIVMDEPTSSLTENEAATLFAQMRRLKEEGVSIIFITHRLDEVFQVADRAVVLRDGAYVGTERIENLTHEAIIRMMVGREIGEIYGQRIAVAAQVPILEVRGLTRRGAIESVSLQLRPGEILGLAGLVGAGRTELAETLFGIHPADSGEIVLDGRRMRIAHPAQAIAAGIGLVPEDRKGAGLFLRMSVGTNIAITLLARISRFGLIPWRKLRGLAGQFIERLNIRTPSAEQRARNLSGGNQQKVVIAKWLTREPKVLILDEPTRGIDVGAKVEIHRLMRELAQQGVGILMISSELPEILGVSDRVLVMHEGRIAAEFDPSTASQDDIMRAATGAAAP